MAPGGTFRFLSPPSFFRESGRAGGRVERRHEKMGACGIVSASPASCTDGDAQTSSIMPPAASKTKSSWETMGRTTTAQQRIQYISSCQSWFADVAHVTCAPEWIAPRHGEVGRRVPSIRNTCDPIYHGDTFDCIVCNQAACMTEQTAFVPNPFSSWALLLCQKCTSTM